MPPRGTESLFGHFAANRVVDHVHAFPGGQFLDCFLERHLGVVNGLVRARRGSKLKLRVAAGGRDDMCAHGLGDLDSRNANAAGGAEYQHRFTRFEVRALFQRVIAGSVSHGKPGALLHAERIR